MERKNSIQVRNDETDVLKLLEKYAKKQGSKNPEKLYMVYTKLVYKTLNIESGLRGQFSFISTFCNCDSRNNDFPNSYSVNEREFSL